MRLFDSELSNTRPYFELDSMPFEPYGRQMDVKRKLNYLKTINVIKSCVGGN